MAFDGLTPGEQAGEADKALKWIDCPEEIAAVVAFLASPGSPEAGLAS
ncbi:hypothetical protein [Haematobacter massiliensis]|nr:hypothetical protein [Haematobacter massiliensis]